MAFKKGENHSLETRVEMSASRTGKSHSAERRAKIGAANSGKVRELRYQRTCACGVAFVTGANNALFCSLKCRRASYGHGLRHAPEFSAFPSRCAICDSVDQLVGDHCHTTGKPRGILCRSCNLAIGNMKDDPKRLRAAAEYLEAS